ncbi:alkene reductase [Mucilaginibacter terrae]|uniref:N-ethylmaleimide reductase n=1 Tax=Mucilaginibacter terrae TaxID=1955052 RepID=A0ABU3GRT1_9SPHI|nr:alkene reductase [Mucilaginibacter terrae]MDT3402355.1 N-ethylmaleimide reductase [Mucilaginibacter terrae]
MEHNHLFTGYNLGSVQLANRIVMASMTRARATNEAMAPTPLHAEYYGQRASAGLILTESVWVSQQAVGYLNIPGIYTAGQVEGWKQVTERVHDSGGKIFVQLVHSGAVSHPYYLNGDLPFGPSAVNPMENVYIPTGFTPTLKPRAYTIDAIKATVGQFRQAALNAKQAGFDGIELHAQLFTLIPQFLSAATNIRTDEYGGSVANRCRILFEILDALNEVFPPNTVGIKFTPAAFNHGIIGPDDDTVDTFEFILQKLTNYGLAFIELVGPRVSLENTAVSAWHENFYGWFRSKYTGTIMANLGLNADSAEIMIEQGKCDLVSFATDFIANPDLVERIRNHWPLSAPDTNTFYSGGANGFADYPAYSVNPAT